MSDTIKLIAKLQDNLSGPLGRTGRSLQKFGRMAAQAASMAAVLGAAVIATAKKMGDMGADVRDAAADLQVSTDAIQALGYAFVQTGGDSETFVKSMRGVTTFMRMAENGGAEQTRVLERLGTTYEQLAAMNPEEQFLFLTDAIGRMTDTTVQATTAATLFGTRYSQQIIGTLDQVGGSIRGVSDAFRESDMLIPEEDIMRLGEFSDKWTELETKLQTLVAEAIMPLLPVIEDMGEKFLEVATDSLPKLIEAAENAIPVLVGMVDAAGMIVDGWGKITQLFGDTSGLESAQEAIVALSNHLQTDLANGLITADDAAAQLLEGLDAMTAGSSLNAEQTLVLRVETNRLAGAFLLARFNLASFLDTSADVGGALSGVGAGFQATGENIVNMLVNVGALGDAIQGLSTTPITTPGLISDDDMETEKERRAELQATRLAEADIIRALELKFQEELFAKRQASFARDREELQATTEERLSAEAEITAARERDEERIRYIGINGAQEIGQIMFSNVEGWETRALQALARMAIEAAAISIGGPIGGVLGFVAGLFQYGGTVRHAQSGTTVPDTGIFGDKHPYLLERGETVTSREQNIMGNIAGDRKPNVILNMTYAPTLSTASPGEAVKLGKEVNRILEDGGYK